MPGTGPPRSFFPLGVPYNLKGDLVEGDDALDRRGKFGIESRASPIDVFELHRQPEEAGVLLNGQDGFESRGGHRVARNAGVVEARDMCVLLAPALLIGRPHRVAANWR